MLPTQAAIESLAERIERAYRLRRPQWHRAGATPGAWTTAAALLHRIHDEDPAMPLDPELFVAVQPARPPFDDPWAELTQPAAARRYRGRVRRIVRALRDELKDEVQRAEDRVRRGEAVGRVLRANGRRLSPLGCYIVARRAGHSDLAGRFLGGAIEQHRSCPLYRLAVARLLPPGDDPLSGPATEAQAPPSDRRKRTQVHLN